MTEELLRIIYWNVGPKAIEVSRDNILTEEILVVMESFGIRRSHLLALAQEYPPEAIYEYVDGCLNLRPMDYYLGPRIIPGL